MSEVRNSGVGEPAIKEPMTPLDLITNIKAAIDHDLFWREDFFDEENLKHFSGAERVEWRFPPSDSRKRAVLTNFGNLVEPLIHGGNVSPGLSLSIDKPTEGRDGKNPILILRFIVSIENSRLENIEKIFGKEWKRYVPLNPPNPSRIYKRPTHPMGNETIEYHFGQGEHPYQLFIEFREDGTTYCLFIKIKGTG